MSMESEHVCLFFFISMAYECDVILVVTCLWIRIEDQWIGLAISNAQIASVIPTLDGVFR